MIDAEQEAAMRELAALTLDSPTQDWTSAEVLDLFALVDEARTRETYWYNADGTVSTFDAETVKAMRIDAAKKLAAASYDVRGMDDLRAALSMPGAHGLDVATVVGARLAAHAREIADANATIRSLQRQLTRRG